MDKMKVKVISKIDFDQEEISKDAIAYIKNDITSNVLGNNPDSFLSSESEKEIENLEKIADENNNDNSFENQIHSNKLKNNNTNNNNNNNNNNNQIDNRKNNEITNKNEYSKEINDNEIYEDNISNIDFINKNNFTQKNTLNPYNNFKPNEIKGILNKLNRTSTQEKIDNIINID